MTSTSITPARSATRERLGSVYNVRRKGRMRLAVRYWVGDERRWELQPDGTTHRQARRRLADLCAASTRGELPRHLGIPFTTYATQWVEDQEALCRAGALKPSTYRDREVTVRVHLIPFFGTLPLDEITKADCRSLQLAKVREGRLSPSTINGRLRVLYAILNQAVDDELINDNPAAGVRRLRSRPRPVNHYEPEEVRRLLQATPARWRAVIAIAAYAGLRQGEILALQWHDINWHTGRIHVRRTLQRADKLLDPRDSPFSAPKTAKSIRAVPLRPIVRDHLQEHRHRHWHPNPCDLIFPNEAGEPVDAHNLLSRVYQPAVRRAGLHQLRFHELRHTFVTHCAAAGVPQEQVRDWVGHTTTRMTELYRAASTSAEGYALAALDHYDAAAANRPERPAGDPGPQRAAALRTA
jgi:integrase